MALKNLSIFAAVVLLTVVLSGCIDQEAYERGEEGAAAVTPAPAPAAAPTPAASGAGGEGLACRADGTCDEGLACGADKVCAKVAAGEQCEGGCPKGYVCKGGKCLNEMFLNDSGSSGSGGGGGGGYSAPKCPTDMAYIAAATFQMGSNEGGQAEKEVHQVTLSAYCMDKYEFTDEDLKESKRRVQSLGTGISWPESPSKFDGDDQPLVMVSWTEADAICKQRGKKLPTEAQWEYAAKTDENCTYGTKSCDTEPKQADACFSPQGSTSKQATCEVGSTNKPNSFGLYDMSGNVWEWVADRYKDSYDAGPVTDPDGPGSGDYRVLRGGSWSFNDPFSLRAAIRYYSVPGGRSNGLGFRCAVAPGQR